MNIKEVKIEIKNTVKAYTRKNAEGRYVMPAVRQRPILLIGPPGIGKTAIMEQIAKECGIGLVAYTITHHTRQSAVGLPVIVSKNYDEKEYTVTEYTMSEIIASVYECMSKTQCREGILFIDEINCVSETLTPTMLQFLQCKTFGTHVVPAGWIIVAAGNPPEYNKSAREFDIVTLDRVKKINVEENFNVWKEYAYEKQLHPCILSYLNLKKEHFYHVENTALGKCFVTARGWEDLSEILYAYEEMDIVRSESLFQQYLQDSEIAASFAGYYQLYQKYKSDYRISKILDGTLEKSCLSEKIHMAKEASFDERIAVIHLFLDGWNGYFSSYAEKSRYASRLKEMIQFAQNGLEDSLEPYIQRRKHAFHVKSENNLLSLSEEEMEILLLNALEKCELERKKQRVKTKDEINKILYQTLDGANNQMRNCIVQTGQALEHGFTFAETAFGNGPELLLLTSELTHSSQGMKFISKFGCDKYFQNSDALMFEQKRQKLLQRIEPFIIQDGLKS